jgi:hypothetical protein
MPDLLIKNAPHLRRQRRRIRGQGTSRRPARAFVGAAPARQTIDADGLAPRSRPGRCNLCDPRGKGKFEFHICLDFM